MDDRAYQITHIAQLLQTHNNGDDHVEMNGKLRDALARCSSIIEEHGGTAKAKLTIEIEIAVDAKGVDVALSAKAALPNPPKVKDRYFVTEKGDGLTLKNPNKGTMFEGTDLGRARGRAASPLSDA